MTSSALFSLALTAFIAFLRLVNADSSPACNPLNGPCPAIPGLPNSEYFVDFTQQTTTPTDWILADYATVGYGSPNGANFTFAKRYDAPYIWTRFYVLFGRIEVIVQAAPGAGIITSAVMMSDDLDEIDWEWSGNNFAGSSGAVQTNYFGKGQVGYSDRGSQPAVDDPEHKFQTYTLDWTPEKLVWSIDGVAVRTLKNTGATTGSYQYPQTPSRLHLGLWCSGDPSTAAGTVHWGGGYTNFSAAPFSAYVKSVKITTSNTCSSWQYPSPFDGTWQSVQCTNQTLALPCTYTVAAGDDGSKIAKNLTVNVDTLKAANPGVNWDQLMVGQVLNVPGAKLFKYAVLDKFSSKHNGFDSDLLRVNLRCQCDLHLSFNHNHIDYQRKLLFYYFDNIWRKEQHHNIVSSFSSSKLLHSGCRRLWLGYCEFAGLLLG
ncbi:hypothetical protein AYO20_06415 [Fonsecaea nubica]|uniref:GH16 domain-containing protein n=1 Tax=Fonsecaea nubica TaxID=856822 RepID=A0A178CYL1_9EURO|nr:hypothetical protein AYO20_06415 [Fonsecaea nubica]OAL34362.1 hypothetical protein AYO20_06415 [Fonsecaea nubica]